MFRAAKKAAEQNAVAVSCCNSIFSKKGGGVLDNRVRTYRKHRKGKTAFRDLAKEYGIEVVDVSGQRDMAIRNITYKAFVSKTSDVSLPKEKTLLFTLRSDSSIRQSGNVFFEIEHTRNNGQKEDGWFFTCQADYIVYYDAASNAATILDWDKTREVIDDGIIGKIQSIVNDGDECITKVCLVSMDELLKNDCIAFKMLQQ